MVNRSPAQLIAIDPVSAETILFGWDPVTAVVTWSMTPLPGEGAITNLTTLSDGTVWGITVGLVFQFDPATRNVVRSIRLRPFDWSSPTHVSA